jgi:hypothetical protein
MERWAREECRAKYLSDPSLSLRKLAEMSGWNRGRLSRWSEEDPDGTWADQRSRHQARLRSEIDRKIIDKASKIVSDDLTCLAEDHYKSHKLAKEIAIVVLQTIARKLAIAQQYGDITTVVGSLNAVEINHWSNIIDRHIKGERQAKGMDYLDINVAIDTVTKAGYEVIDIAAKNQEENY